MQRKLASLYNYRELLEKVATKPRISLDTEATGLFPFLGDRLFSVIIASDDFSYYFNFNTCPDHYGRCPDGSVTLDRAIIKTMLDSFNGTIYMHNAKYDMHLLKREGLDLSAFDVHCTSAIARVEKNNRMSYELDRLAKEIGFAKDEIKSYVNKNRLYTFIEKIGGTKYKKLHYEQVPFDMMVEYGHKDAEITYQLGIHQEKRIAQLDRQFGKRKYRINYVFENEKRLTKTLYRMEQSGIALDHSYVEGGLQFEEKNLADAKAAWRAATGMDFKDSGKVFATAFTNAGIPFPKTEKGNPCFKKEVLDELDNDLTKIIKRHRAAEKTVSYYRNFLFLESKDGRIHANIKQGGTETGRMSYSDPNLQNLPKIESDDERYTLPFNVRGAVTPSKDFYLFMLDYDQQEYRLMLDYAGEEKLIEKILSGLDVHVATGEMMETPRKEAKTLNFMLLYGGGVAKLCLAICSPFLQERDLKLLARLLFQEKWSVEKIKRFLGKEFKIGKEVLVLHATPEQVDHDYQELLKARAKKDLYRTKIPTVESFIKGVISKGKERGFVFNWAGRICNVRRGFEYILPNHIIQGGCGDIVKIAMNRIDDLISQNNVKSRMIIQVHDELVFEIHKDELWLIPKIKNIMENIYPYNHLPLTVGVEWSAKSWQHKEEWNGAETGDNIPSMGVQKNRSFDEQLVRVDRPEVYSRYAGSYWGS